MASINEVTLLGRLGKDPEAHTTGSVSLSNFSIATSKKWKDKATGEPKEKTEWHNIVVWRQQADFVNKYIKKGYEVFIKGELTTEAYEKDGQKRYVTKIVANSVQIVSGGAKPNESKPVEENHHHPDGFQSQEDDNLPF